MELHAPTHRLLSKLIAFSIWDVKRLPVFDSFSCDSGIHVVRETAISLKHMESKNSFLNFLKPCPMDLSFKPRTQSRESLLLDPSLSYGFVDQ